MDGLAHWQARGNRTETKSHHRFSYPPLPGSATLLSRTKRVWVRDTGARLIRQPSHSRSPDFSLRHFLCDHHNSNVARIPVAEIDLQILRKARGLVQVSNAGEASQDGNMPQDPSGVLPPAHMRFI